MDRLQVYQRGRSTGRSRLPSQPGLRAVPADRCRDDPQEAHRREQTDDGKRGDAIQTIDLENVPLDAGEIQTESQSYARKHSHQVPPPGKRQAAQYDVAGDADSCHGNMEDLSVGAVVYDPAVPFLIDGAGLGLRRVMDAQGERGDHCAGEGEKGNREPHGRYDEEMGQLPDISRPPRLAGLAAFFGGSFDPPHLGHLAVARAARSALSLD